jgi:hypothetical protein
MTKEFKPVRLTVHTASRELGISSRALKRKLLSQAVIPGLDGMFSMRQIFDALNGVDDLERSAKEARWKAKIDEAAYAKLRLAEKRNTLIPVAVVLERAHDTATTFFQCIRHSSMPKAEQRQLIDQVLQVYDRKFPSNGSPESKSAIHRWERIEEERQRERKTVATRNGQKAK